jgi:hypothetical protein
MTGHHAEHCYFRVLPLADFGVARDFEVAWIQLAIGDVSGVPARGPVAVRLHTLAGERLLANLTRIAETIIERPDPAPAWIQASFANAVVLAGHALVIEVIFAGDRDPRDFASDLSERDAGRRGFAATAAGRTGPVFIDTTSDVPLTITIHGSER